MKAMSMLVKSYINQAYQALSMDYRGNFYCVSYKFSNISITDQMTQSSWKNKLASLFVLILGDATQVNYERTPLFQMNKFRQSCFSKDCKYFKQ